MCFDYSSAIPTEDLDILYDIGKHFGFDPLLPAECEQYFVDRLECCKNMCQQDKKVYLEKEIAKDFKFNSKIPEWLQAAEWQFNKGKPMIFVGQIKLPISKDGLTYTSAFYVFWDMRDGEIKTIMQTD